MADSWKTDGNCNECRRQSYCGKSCTAHKNAIKNLVLSWLKKRGSTDAIKAQLQGKGEYLE